MKLKLGELNATLLCHYTSLSRVANDIFGEKDDTAPLLQKGEYEDLAAAPSFDAALASINRALSYG